MNEHWMASAFRVVGWTILASLLVIGVTALSVWLLGGLHA